MMTCNLLSIVSNQIEQNQKALSELFEFSILYDIVENFSSSFLKFNLIDSNQMKVYTDSLFALLPKIRQNAVCLVDSFDFLDSNLCKFFLYD